MDATVTLGQQGRLVIPAEVREALGLQAGDRLHLRAEGGQVILERPSDAKAQLLGMYRDIAPGRSLADELIAERRIAAAAGD